VPGKLLLVRHGQSTWNLENLFTGWTDVDLTEQGIEEARRAGAEIARAGLSPEYVLTSVLKRAIRTEWLILEQLDLLWLPALRDWRLNERHYGALQGLNKAQTAAAYGEAQVRIWRRSFDIAPPPLSADDARHPRFDRRYAGVAAAELPATESLKDTLARVRPCWEQCIAPQLRANRQVMIVAHGNSLRALVMMLDRLSAEAIVELNIPTGVPLLYELDDALQPLSSRYLGDAAAVAAAAEAVRRQGEARA
jgi:2,3-bisphosphoglycerate-dependent phosphoglycerate mutase